MRAQGEKAVGALVIFQATEVREATEDERRALMEAQRGQCFHAPEGRTPEGGQTTTVGLREANRAP
jgi:hypothetical protein